MLVTEFLTATKVSLDLIFKTRSPIRLKFILTCVIDVVAIGLSVAAPAFLKLLIDMLNAKSTAYTVIWLGVGYGTTWVLSELLLRLRGYMTTEIIEEAKREAITRLCIHTILKQKKTDNVSSGTFSAKMAQVSSALPIFIDGTTWQIAPLLVRLLLSVGALAAFAPAIYPLLLVASVIAFIFVSIATYSKIGERQRRANIAMQNSSSRILDALSNKEIIIAHATELEELAYLENAMDEQKDSAISSVAFAQKVSAAQIFLLGLGLIVITAKAVIDVKSGVLTVGELVQINAYVLQFVLPVSYFGLVLSGIKRASVSLGENAKDLLSCSGREFDTVFALTSRPIGIVLRNVTIKSSEGHDCLKYIDLDVRPGECIAIVGSSGAGKSTLAKAIMGLYEPDSGSIEIDSIRVSASSIRSLRKNIGYVPQDPHLFDKSLSDNVFMKEKEAEFMEDVFSRSGLDLNMLPSSIKETCKYLSGGEKQRIAFARALAREPAILILDEPSASLDAHSKSIISQTVFERCRKVTRLLITHDLELASRADRIVVLSAGRIIEVGSHKELIRNEGWYRDHWMLGNTLASTTKSLS